MTSTTRYYNIFEEEVVQKAEACLAECDKETLFAPVGTYGLTLFHLLVWHNFYNAIEKMIDDGRVGTEEINMSDHKGYGFTPFLLACFRGNLAMVQLLIAHGADTMVSDKRGMNAYHILAYPSFEGLVNAGSCLDKSMKQRKDIARLLTCDINQKDENEFTPLVRLLSTSYRSNYAWALTEIFLEKGAKTDYVDENGNTLLMLALRNNYMTAALALMDQCPEMVNIASKDGRTPIQQALDFNNMGIYLALVDHGATTTEKKHISMDDLSQLTSHAFGEVSDDEKDKLGLAIYLAGKLIQKIDMDDEDELGYISDVLYNAMISDDQYHILDACKEAGIDLMVPIHFRGSITCLRDECLHVTYGIGAIHKMIQLGVNMDEAVLNGCTPANIVASMDRQTGWSQEREVYFGEAAKTFSKESMEQLNNQGKAAVHIAAKNGHVGMLEVMIEKGVDINISEDVPAEAGITALHEACAYGYADVVKLLMDAGADDTIQNVKGETPAHFAVMKKKSVESLNEEQRAKLLRELKNIDIANEEGRTPFMLLQLLDFTTCRELLPIFLERNVDVNHADNTGKTAFILNIEYGTDKDMIKELIQAGADIHVIDQEGNTGLHYALQSGNIEVARYLIKKGADYNHSNNDGETPVQIAVENGYETVLELMTNIE